MMFEKEIAASTKRSNTYKTREEYKKYIDGSWDSGLSKEDLQLFLDTAVPGVSIAPPQDAGRLERRNLSQKMRENFTNLFLYRAFDRPKNLTTPDGKPLKRWMMSIIEDAATPESEERNRKAVRILTGDDKQAKTQLVTERLQEAATMIQRSYTMSDAQITENFAQLYNAYNLVWESENLAGETEELDVSHGLGELGRDIKKRWSGKAGYVSDRIKKIANPLYEEFDPALMTEKMDYGKAAALSQLMGKSDYYQQYALNIYSEQTIPQSEAEGDKELAKEDALRSYMAAAGLDQKEAAFYDPDNGGKNIVDETKHDRYERVRSGKNIAAVFPDGKAYLFSVKEGADHQPTVVSTEVVPVFGEAGKDELDELEQLLKDVDPRLMKSSDAFKRMQNELAMVREQFKLQGSIFNQQDRNDLSRALGQLATAAENYLEYKQVKHNGGKTEHERIEAAKRIRAYAQNKLSDLRWNRNAIYRHKEADMPEENLHLTRMEPVRVEKLFTRADTEKLKSLQDGLKAADSRFAKSSEEFKRMKDVLAEAKDNFWEDGDTLSVTQRLELEQRMRVLEEASQDYLDYKEENHRGTDYEIKRIEAAKQIHEYARKKLESLKKVNDILHRYNDYLEVLEPGQKAPEKKAQRQVSGQKKTELQPKAPEQQAASDGKKNPVQQPVQEAKAPEEQAPRKEKEAQADATYTAAMTQRMNERADDYRRLFERMKNGSAADTIFRDAGSGLNGRDNQSISQMAGENAPFDEKKAAAARTQMATMVAAEILLRERMTTGEKKMGEVEQALNKMKDPRDFVKNIEKNPAFAEATQNLTPKGYCEFVGKRREGDLADRVMGNLQAQKSRKDKEASAVSAEKTILQAKGNPLAKK